MTLIYQISKIPDKKTIKTCDEGAKGMQELLVTTAKLVGGWKTAALIWILSRFYTRTISNNAITYDFYLVPVKESNET